MADDPVRAEVGAAQVDRITASVAGQVGVSHRVGGAVILLEGAEERQC